MFPFGSFLSLLLLITFAGATAIKCCMNSNYNFTNVFIGTTGAALWAEGGMSPAAQVPYGALRLGPDTTTVADFFLRHYSGYNYRDTTIRAFSHTRCVGSGVSDFGNFGI